MKQYIRTENDFGGSSGTGKRKTARPLIFGEPIHFILKAVEDTNLIPYKTKIEEIIQRLNRKFKVQSLGIGVHIDHIHQIPILPNRQTYSGWARAMTGVLTRQFQIQWRQIPFTKFVPGDRDYLRNLITYVEQNRREGELCKFAQCRVNAFENFAGTLWANS